MTSHSQVIMETPCPEELLFNFNLEYNNINLNFSIIDKGDNNTLKLVSKEQDAKIMRNYEAYLEFNDLKRKYKYFKMFDDFKEYQFNFIELCKRKNNLKINSLDENELILVIDLNIIVDNLMNISLKRTKLTDKEQKEILLIDLEFKNREIDELKTEIKNIKKIINLKDDKIAKLEENIKKLSTRLDNVEKKFDSIEIFEKSNKNIEEINNNKSGIINNKKEYEFLFNAISPNNKVSLVTVFNSVTEGENKEKLKSAYIGVNDILILVRTKKGKRFGGYAHESFEDKEFQKQDKKAFLFSLDKLKIYKSKGTEHTIWNFNLDSIDFGWGTDLRIFHDFKNNKNYTNQSTDFEYNDENFALNEEKYFDISCIELYRVNFN